MVVVQEMKDEKGVQMVKMVQKMKGYEGEEKEIYIR